jgi:lipoprotein-anchoring transpeptidase ErfK/SrfK
VVFPARRLAVGLGAAALALTACGPAVTADVDFQTVTPSAQSRASVLAQPASAKRVDPDQRIVVKASDGQLSSVTVVGPKGPMRGELSPDGTVWTAKKATLDFGATYTVQATAVDARGVPTTQTDQIRTKKPKDFFSGSVLPDAGTTVGVGMPITVTFDHQIKEKADVERAMIVRTPEPLLGAWSWKSGNTVEFRPRKYWPGNIAITVDLNLKGVQSDKGVFGKDNTSTTFSTGPSMVTKVNAQSHVAKVYRNGKKARTIPITTGKDGFETRSGTVLIVSKERTRIMDAATGGTSKNDPEYYRLEVEYAMRITYSGEFLHAAPWSVGSQGYANVSHGCVGMSTSNAQWLYGNTDVGDVVEITGTSSPQNLGNGITVWTQTWDEWLADSKAGPVRTLPSVEVPAAPGTSPAIPGDPGSTLPLSGGYTPGASSGQPVPAVPSAPVSSDPLLTQQTSFGR